MALAPLTTLNVGGPARFFVRAETEDQVAEAVEFAARRGLELFVLGGGSNVVVSDDGFDGLVLNLVLRPGSREIDRWEAGATEDAEEEIKDENGSTKDTKEEIEIKEIKEEKSVRIVVPAGASWDGFVEYCVANGLAGVECMSGIPGSVGGTPVQNVGAYGQEVSETIESVRCFDRQANGFVTLGNAECGFSYRRSIFNSTHRGRYIVVSVAYRLLPGGRPKIVYKDLIEHFQGREPSLRDTREAVIAIRRAKSMVIDDGDPNRRSAGSFFKNPIVAMEKLTEIREKNALDDVPHFPAGDGRAKIPAAWLIERAGFRKGHRMGNAGISTKHSLALVNNGGATASEIIELKNAIQAAVEDKFGIGLEPEPIFVGF